jgi:hypothetical protein
VREGCSRGGCACGRRRRFHVMALDLPKQDARGKHRTREAQPAARVSLRHHAVDPI